MDTHAHLADAVFDPDRAEVLARAAEAGVGAVVTVGETLREARRILDLAGAHPLLRPAAGLYPGVLEPAQALELSSLIRDNRSRLSAIGEVGLDYWLVKEEPHRERQREIFALFVELSLETGLPLNVHSRSAGRQAVELLLERGARRVQLHAFDGRAAAALPAVEAGYLFSVPASVVRSRQKQKLVRALPLGCLLLETDSPVLGPQPASRNEPANLTVALQAVAALKGLAPEEVREAVWENTTRLYGDLTAPAAGATR